jgi:hypothetical protein
MSKTQEILDKLLALPRPNNPYIERIGQQNSSTGKGSFLYRHGDFIFVNGGAQRKIVEQSPYLREEGQLSYNFRFYRIL